MAVMPAKKAKNSNDRFLQRNRPIARNLAKEWLADGLEMGSVAKAGMGKRPYFRHEVYNS